MIYPIGIQTFENLRTGGYVYVDKTALIYRLVSEGAYYFLSRPRRFGKSLLVSTLESYFEGRRDLFEGLAIDGLETEWKSSPVLHLDLSGVQYGDPTSLDSLLHERLRRWEKQYAVRHIADKPGLRFINVIHAAYEQTGSKVAILIDEYDKPILSNIEKGETTDLVRSKLKAFYSVLKSEDRYIRFALLTGVTRFSKVSIFSDLNNLTDISMDPGFAGLCGISEKELHQVFDNPVAALAEANGMTQEQCYDELKHRYDGYHFAIGTAGMYNPFSVLNAMRSKQFSSYWFATGTPTFLVDCIRRTGFDFTRDLHKPVPEAMLADIDTLDQSPMSILFQSGYLTLKGYEPMFRRYTLDFPNAEVREGFITFLLPRITADRSTSLDSAVSLVESVNSGDPEGIVGALKLLFDKHGNYMLYEEKSKERDFRNIVYMTFSVLGIYTQAELCTAHGRLDISAETDDYAYIIELKIDQSAAKALDQIKEGGYAHRFEGDPRRVFLMGVNFSTATNSINDWAVE